MASPSALRHCGPGSNVFMNVFNQCVPQKPASAAQGPPYAFFLPPFHIPSCCHLPAITGTPRSMYTSGMRVCECGGGSTLPCSSRAEQLCLTSCSVPEQTPSCRQRPRVCVLWSASGGLIRLGGGSRRGPPYTVPNPAVKEVSC
jgi:hypothetical protein